MPTAQTERRAIEIVKTMGTIRVLEGMLGAGRRRRILVLVGFG